MSLVIDNLDDLRTFLKQTVIKVSNVEEMKARVTEKPFTDQNDLKNKGNIPVDDKNLKILKSSLDAAFKPNGIQPPEFQAAGASCA